MSIPKWKIVLTPQDMERKFVEMYHNLSIPSCSPLDPEFSLSSFFQSIQSHNFWVNCTSYSNNLKKYQSNLQYLKICKIKYVSFKQCHIGNGCCWCLHCESDRIVESICFKLLIEKAKNVGNDFNISSTNIGGEH